MIKNLSPYLILAIGHFGPCFVPLLIRNEMDQLHPPLEQNSDMDNVDLFLEQVIPTMAINPDSVQHN